MAKVYVTIKKREFHGRRHDPLYSTWDSMRRRCLFPTATLYKNYGGRGITVCQRWLDSFADFCEDMGPRPSPKHTIERIDNDGPYSPANCQWATRHDQMRNNRRNVILEHDGKRMCVVDWAKYLGVNHKTLEARLRRYKWSVERALTEPFDNTRLCRMITFNGETLPIRQWEIRTGISTKTIKRRLAKGWTIESALTVEPAKMGLRCRKA